MALKKTLFLLLIAGIARAEQCQITSPLPVPVTISGCTFSGSLPNNSTSYIQNTLSPTTTTQMFSVQTSSVSGSETLGFLGGTQCLQEVNGLVSGAGAACGSSSGGGSGIVSPGTFTWVNNQGIVLSTDTVDELFFSGNDNTFMQLSNYMNWGYSNSGAGSTTLNLNKAFTMANPGVTVTISSNTILPGATFYQNGNIVVSTPIVPSTYTTTSGQPWSTIDGVIFSQNVNYPGLGGTQLESSFWPNYAGSASTFSVIANSIDVKANATQTQCMINTLDANGINRFSVNTAGATQMTGAVTMTAGYNASGGQATVGGVTGNTATFLLISSNTDTAPSAGNISGIILQNTAAINGDYTPIIGNNSVNATDTEIDFIHQNATGMFGGSNRNGQINLSVSDVGDGFLNPRLEVTGTPQVISLAPLLVTGSSMSVIGPQGFTSQYNVNAGSYTGAGLATCGDATHGLGYNSSNQFTCQSITGLPGNSTNYIWNSSVLQAGATAYPSFAIIGSSQVQQGNNSISIGGVFPAEQVLSYTTDPSGLEHSALFADVFSSPSSASSGFQDGAIFRSDYTTSYNGLGLFGFSEGAEAIGSFSGGGSIDSVYGFEAFASDGSSGTVTSNIGLRAIAKSAGPSPIGGTTTSQMGVYAQNSVTRSTATNNYGYYADNATAGIGGSITNNYGLYVNKQTVGTSLNYGVYSNNNNDVFTGTATIGALNLTTLQGVTPGLIAGTNITSITGTWPNQTINAAAGSAGGSSALAVQQNAVNVTSPTVAINFLSPPFTVTLVNGSTSQVTLNGSSVTLQGTITSATLGDLTTSSATATYLQLSSATATYLNKNNAVTLSSLSAAQPILYNSATGAFAATLISLSTGVVGILPAANLPTTTVFTTSSNTFTSTQTFNNTVIISTTIGAGSLGATGSSGQALLSNGPGTAVSWGNPSASAGGSSGQIQWNNSTSLNGITGSNVGASSITIGETEYQNLGVTGTTATYTQSVVAATLTVNTGNAVFQKGVVLGFTSVSGNYTETSTDTYIAASGNITGGIAPTVTLLAATGSGRIVTVTKVDTSTEPITIQTANGTDTMVASTFSITLNAFQQTCQLIDNASGAWGQYGECQITPSYVGLITVGRDSTGMNAANDGVFEEINLTVPCAATGIRFANGGTQASNHDVGLYTGTGIRIITQGSTAHGTINTVMTFSFTTPINLWPGQYFLALSAVASTDVWVGFQQATGASQGYGILNTVVPLPASFTPANLLTQVAAKAIPQLQLLCQGGGPR